MANKLGLEDFSPKSQDTAAVALMDERGALEPLVAGDVRGFVNKLGDEWASLPSSSAKQHHRSWGEIQSYWDTTLPSRAPAPTVRPEMPLPAVPVDPVARAPLPNIPGVVTRAALPDLPSPAAGARAASEMQGYVPGSITLPDVPAALSTPPTIAAPMSYPSVANPPAGLTLSLPGTTTLQGVHTMPAAPRDMPTLPSPVAPPAQVPAALPSVPAPTVDRAATRSLPSVAVPPAGLSINLPSAVPPTSVQTSKAGLIADFPEAPPAPGRQAAIDAAKGAAKGIMAGGLPGMIGGAILGPAMAQIGRNRASNALGVGSRISPFNGVLGAYKNIFGRMSLPSFGSIFGGMTPNYGAAQYGIGSGYGAIGSAFGAPAGATAYSRSNPEVTFTSLGNGMVSRSNAKTGVTYTMSADDYNPGSAGRSGGSSGKGSSGKGTGGLY
ncbi:MAG: hypothetical protein J0H53_02845 [Rhizobiales bacterium]|nr:hypothetical protein [Hyphomicrobiales bacterium]